MNEKVIVTNLAALRAKYGSGLAKIEAALGRLIAADKARGLTTQVIDVSSAAAMKKVKGTAVAKAANPRQNKAAVDAIYRALLPDYVMLLGAIDVIPHQDMKNPVFDPANGDPDEFAYGDLPYACEAAYSEDARKFIGPTRVVGRLPDLTGSNDPAYLVRLLDTAAKYQPRKRAEYGAYLGISAKDWMKSTALSLEKLFGNNKDLQTSPAKGPRWTAAQLGRRAHFINCHGAASTPQFFGQEAGAHPVAHSADLLPGKISEGTIAAVECCYGGELYDAAEAGTLPGICSAYLDGGAYGYLGSTTVSYGPPESNGAADLICRYFLGLALSGASLGRAALEARQRFAQASAQIDPYDLKTLAQFNLLGDPAIHPVVVPSTSVSVVAPKAAAGESLLGRAVNRLDRRRALISKGLQIEASQWVARRMEAPKAGGALATSLRKLAATTGIAPANILSFELTGAARMKPALHSKALSALTDLGAPQAFHVIAQREERASERGPHITGIVAKEVAGKIVSYRELRSR